MYRYKKKKGKKKERRRNFSQFSCPQCSYLSETVLKCTTHLDGFFFFGMVLEIGLEQVKSRHAGGMSQPPVQTLVATMIVSSPISSTKKKPIPTGMAFCF